MEHGSKQRLYSGRAGYVYNAWSAGTSKAVKICFCLLPIDSSGGMPVPLASSQRTTSRDYGPGYPEGY